MLPILFVTALLAAEPQTKPFWSFDPNTLMLTGENVAVRLRPVGQMHGVVIEKMRGKPSPVANGRAFLNLEHYLEKGRSAEYLPRKLDHTVTMNRESLSIAFPPTDDWALASRLTYTWTQANTIDARLDFEFAEDLQQFEVYFTSYFQPNYQRRMKLDGEWRTPKISDREQLLIPRDDKIAGRFDDGRWAFLGDRPRLADERFDIPVMISEDNNSGMAIIQMIEPDACTHLAPNRFAVGHNFIIGGWDVRKGEKRSARIRMIIAQKPSVQDVEKAYREFTEWCQTQNETSTEKPGGKR